MTSTFQAIILGVIQGLTEFLPVSSSGHLIITSFIMDGAPLPLYFNISLHAGTCLALLIYFAPQWWSLIQDGIAILQRKKPITHPLIMALVVGSIPAGVTGILAEKMIEGRLHKPLIVACNLAVFGLLLWFVDFRSANNKSGVESISLKDAVWIGLAQTLALIPGVSRSGITVTAGRGLGFQREGAMRFSFLLAMPVTLGACLLHSGDMLAHATETAFLTGVFSSFISGCIAIKFMMHLVPKIGFLPFAIYRILLGAAIIYVECF